MINTTFSQAEQEARLRFLERRINPIWTLQRPANVRIKHEVISCRRPKQKRKINIHKISSVNYFKFFEETKRGMKSPYYNLVLLLMLLRRCQEIDLNLSVHFICWNRTKCPTIFKMLLYRFQMSYKNVEKFLVKTIKKRREEEEMKLQTS